MKMKKREVVFKNVKEVSDQLAKFKASKPLVDAVLTEWSKLKLDPIDLQELTGLLRGDDIQKIVKQSIIEHLKPEDLLLAGRTVSKETMGSLLVPPDVTDLEAAVNEASVHFPPLGLCEIVGNKLELSKTKVEELEQANVLFTSDTEMLEQVKSIIAGVKYLIDRNLVPKGIVSDLIRWHVVDKHVLDDLQPSRILFTKKS